MQYDTAGFVFAQRRADKGSDIATVSICSRRRAHEKKPMFRVKYESTNDQVNFRDFATCAYTHDNIRKRI